MSLSIPKRRPRILCAILRLLTNDRGFFYSLFSPILLHCCWHFVKSLLQSRSASWCWLIIIPNVLKMKIEFWLNIKWHTLCWWLFIIQFNFIPPFIANLKDYYINNSSKFHFPISLINFDRNIYLFIVLKRSPTSTWNLKSVFKM